MKKAALITHGPLEVVGGVERSHNYLVALLRRDGFAVDIFEPSMQKNPAWLPGFAYPFVQFFFTGCPARELHDNYDLIVTTGYTGGHLRGPKVLTYCFGSVKSCTGSFDMGASWKIALMNKMAVVFDALSRKGKTTVAMSEQVSGELRKDYGAESIAVPSAVDTQHFSPRPGQGELRKKWGIDTELPVGAYIGRWAWNQKGLDVLTAVMKKRGDIHWLVCADVIEKMDGVKNLTSVKGASYDDLPGLYSAADFCIQLSRYESFGYSFVESLACGTPVITTPVGAAAPAYRGTDLEPLLVPRLHQEKENMVRETENRIDLLRDRAFCRRLGSLAREIAIREFSLPVWEDKIREVLRGMGATK